MPSDGSQQLLWRATFIDDWAEAAEGQPAVRRAQSEPLPRSQGEAQELFGAEREYVEALAARAGRLCSPAADEKHSQSSAASETSADGEDAACPGKEAPGGRAPRGVCASAFLSETSTAASVCSPIDSPRCGAGRSPWSCAGRSPQRRGRSRLASRGLSVALEPLANQEPVTVALAIMQGMPEQLEEDLQRQGLQIVSDVQRQVTALCGDILSSGTSPQEHVQSAVEQLGAIPELVMTSMGDGAAQTRLSLESHLGAVEKDMRDQAYGCEPMAAQLARAAGGLPEEIRELTSQAVEEALRESKALAARQVCRAMTSLPESWALEEAGNRLVSATFAMPSAALTSEAVEAAALTVEQAVAAAEGSAAAPRQAVHNQVVAANLLRAKCERPPEAVASSVPHSNPGSFGHPHLCARPCIFFARGECTNGTDCTYCHGDHHSRVRHLDKMGRDCLRRLGFVQRAELALPVLQQQAREQGLGEGILSFLAELEKSIRPEAGRAGGSSVSASVRHKLLKSLSVLSFRAVLTHVCRGDDTPEWLQGAALHAELSRLAEAPQKVWEL